MINLKLQHSILSLLTLLFFLTWASASFADPVTTTVTIKVTVVAEPCVINGNKPINVNFGNGLLTTQVNGTNYIKTIDYTLDCSGAASDGMKMTISGTAASFDSTALQASQADLGIKFLADAQSYALNTPLNFDRNTPPVLQAVPVKAPGGSLVGGEFTASATMKVEYQ